MGHGSFVCDVTALDEAAGLIAAILVARHGPERGDYDVEVRRAGERMALIGVAEGIRVRALLDAGRAEGVLGTSLVQLRDALRPMCGAVEQRGGQDREPAQLWWDEGAVRLGGCGGTRRLEARRVSARAGGGRRAARVADAAAEQFAAVLDAAWSASADGEVWFEALAGVIRFGGANGRRATVASAPADAKGRGGRVVVDGARLRSLVYWAGPDSGRVTVDVAAVDGVPFVTVRRGELEACFEGRWERSDVPRLMRPLDEPIVADRDPLVAVVSDVVAGMLRRGERAARLGLGPSPQPGKLEVLSAPAGEAAGEPPAYGWFDAGQLAAAIDAVPGAQIALRRCGDADWALVAEARDGRPDARRDVVVTIAAASAM